jgi:hypothetical protein
MICILLFDKTSTNVVDGHAIVGNVLKCAIAMSVVQLRSPIC